MIRPCYYNPGVIHNPRTIRSRSCKWVNASYRLDHQCCLWSRTPTFKTKSLSNFILDFNYKLLPILRFCIGSGGQSKHNIYGPDGMQNRSKAYYFLHWRPLQRKKKEKHLLSDILSQGHVYKSLFWISTYYLHSKTFFWNSAIPKIWVKITNSYS